jgi:hypothetical protein
LLLKHRIYPKPDDMLQVTFTGERIADVGQPRELDSFYKACHDISRLPGQLFKKLINLREDYCNLSINTAVTTQKKADIISVSEVVNKWKYYHPYPIVGTICSEKKPLLDSLISSSHQKSREATECVKQLLMRERDPKKWKSK